jgi:hypothetical protein
MSDSRLRIRIDLNPDLAFWLKPDPDADPGPSLDTAPGHLVYKILKNRNFNYKIKDPDRLESGVSILAQPRSACGSKISAKSLTLRKRFQRYRTTLETAN